MWNMKGLLPVGGIVLAVIVGLFAVFTPSLGEQVLVRSLAVAFDEGHTPTPERQQLAQAADREAISPLLHLTRGLAPASRGLFADLEKGERVTMAMADGRQQALLVVDVRPLLREATTVVRGNLFLATLQVVDPLNGGDVRVHVLIERPLPETMPLTSLPSRPL